jgi:hypothetical protein
MSANNHTAAGEHAGTPNHPDGHGADHRTATRCRAHPQVAAGLSGGGASADPRSVDRH